jgi:AraC family transcriptional regulator of adaptative response/methylated-DNA-[protein]-cysteine methyltransferase
MTRIGWAANEGKATGAIAVPCATIRYAIAACGLGRVMLAMTDRGVCAVSIADQDEVNLTFLRAEFPGARLEWADTVLAEPLTALRRLLAGEVVTDLPLDPQGTEFQRCVWQALLAIPRGETRTYNQVAAAIGRPTAARAVARACATNPVSILIPCHRVVGTDGTLRGYRWGLARKIALLTAERSVRSLSIG